MHHGLISWNILGDRYLIVGAFPHFSSHMCFTLASVTIMIHFILGWRKTIIGIYQERYKHSFGKWSQLLIVLAYLCGNDNQI